MDEETLTCVAVDPAAEERCRLALHGYLSSRGARSVEKNVGELMSLEGGFVERFHYVGRYSTPDHLQRLLVSGCAVGSEMLVARRFGYREVHGSEVVPRYVDLASERLRGLPGFDVRLYDGAHLPWPDGAFTAIMSGHIIEHTPAPEAYLHEHLRVLAPGGLLFLEFPDRYHRRELHTGLPSVEWLPGRTRDLALHFLERCQALSRRTRALYRDVRTTLKPISVRRVRAWLASSGVGGVYLAHAYHPLPGFTRCVIRR